MTRKIETRETKGPVGDETPPVPPSPEMAEVLATQQKLADLLGQVGPLAFKTAAQSDDLAQRVDVLEKANLALIELVRHLCGAVQQAAARRF